MGGKHQSRTGNRRADGVVHYAPHERQKFPSPKRRGQKDGGHQGLQSLHDALAGNAKKSGAKINFNINSNFYYGRKNKGT